MTVRMYSSLDAGAPALSNLGTTRWIDNLKAVLKACLIDGYSGKPSAGWTIGHEHADGISFGNGEGFVNFAYHTHLSGVVGYIMEAITDGTTAIASGVNKRSGPWYEGASTIYRQYFYATVSGTNANKAWAVVADEKTVTAIFQVSTSVDEGNSAQSIAIHFGRYYPVVGGNGFILLGGNSQGVYNGGAVSIMSFAPHTGCSLRNPYNGLAAQGVDPLYQMYVKHGISNTLSYIQPSVSSRIAQFWRASLFAVGSGLTGSSTVNTPSYAGVLRGVMGEANLSAYRLSQLIPLLGGAASPTASDRLKSVTVGGKEIWPIQASTTEAVAFVSLDELDWEPLWT